MSGEQTGAELASEIRALVERELAGMGVRGAVRMDGDFLVLGRGSPEPRAEIRGTLAQWDSLPEDLRARRIRQIAALLSEREPAQFSPPAPAARADHAPRRHLGLRWHTVFAPILIVCATAGAINLAYRYLAPRGGFSLFPAPSSSAPAPAVRAADPDRERFVFASSACNKTLARVAQGASIGPADTEGWVVELVLLRRGAPVDLAHAPGLSKFVTRKPDTETGTLSWAPAAHLMAAQRFDAEVALTASPPLGEGHLSGLSVVFSGPYVLPYFTEDQRAEYLKLADALATELEATDGALFARCASSESHHIGSWYLGPSPGAAVASLVYFMAGFNEVPLLKPNVLGTASGPPQRGHTFDTINAAAANMNRNAAATLIGRELGMVSGGREHATHLTFPFRDANRASRASVLAARSLQLANSG